MIPNTFREALRYRLSLPLYDNAVAGGTAVRCGCGLMFDMTTSPYHFLCCNRTANWYYTKRHNAVASVLCGFLKKVRPDAVLALEASVGEVDGVDRRGDVRMTLLRRGCCCV